MARWIAIATGVGLLAVGGAVAQGLPAGFHRSDPIVNRVLPAARRRRRHSRESGRNLWEVQSRCSRAAWQKRRG